MHKKVNTKSEQNFNPGLAIIGLSGPGPWSQLLKCWIAADMSLSSG